MDKDNDGWDDVYEDARGSDKNSASSTPSDNDGDTVKLTYPGTTDKQPLSTCATR